jgi:hypothetical protein
MNGSAEWKLDPKSFTVDEVAKKTRRFLFDECFSALQPTPPAPHSLEFWVGGYGSDRSKGHAVWKIEIVNGHCTSPSTVLTGGATSWFVGGQVDPITRLAVRFDRSLQDLLMSAGMDTNSATNLITFLRSKLEVPLLFPTMPVQDAIELADFLSSTTKNYYRFLPGADIVGGDTDIAVVAKHEGFKWIKRKHYYAAHLNPARDRPGTLTWLLCQWWAFLLPVIYKNLVIWLIVCVDTPSDQGEGLTRNNCLLVDCHWFSISEAGHVYYVASPSVGTRVIIGIACGRVRHSIINVHVHLFQCSTLGVHTFDGVDKILTLP